MSDNLPESQVGGGVATMTPPETPATGGGLMPEPGAAAVVVTPPTIETPVTTTVTEPAPTGLDNPETWNATAQARTAEQNAPKTNNPNIFHRALGVLGLKATTETLSTTPTTAINTNALNTAEAHSYISGMPSSSPLPEGANPGLNVSGGAISTPEMTNVTQADHEASEGPAVTKFGDQTADGTVSEPPAVELASPTLDTSLGANTETPAPETHASAWPNSEQQATPQEEPSAAEVAPVTQTPAVEEPPVAAPETEIPEYKPTTDLAPAGEAAAPATPEAPQDWSVDASAPHADAPVVPTFSSDALADKPAASSDTPSEMASPDPNGLPLQRFESPSESATSTAPIVEEPAAPSPTIPPAETPVTSMVAEDTPVPSMDTVAPVAETPLEPVSNISQFPRPEASVDNSGDSSNGTNTPPLANAA